MNGYSVKNTFARFIAEFDAIADLPEDRLFARGSSLLVNLVATDDWLPEEYRVSDPTRYRQYLLHRDDRVRFSVASFVWGPGQATPIHDHCTWGLIGILRGVEISTRFDLTDNGLVERVPEHRLLQGEVDMVSPTVGDIHRVTNGLVDDCSISIHVYGGDIGKVQRHTYQADGTVSEFVSGYSNSVPDGSFSIA